MYKMMLFRKEACDVRRYFICFVLFFAFLGVIVQAKSDIDGHWANDAVYALADKGILVGDGKGNFMPDREITRAEFLCAVLNAIGANAGSVDITFSDVKDNDFYAPYISKAAELGIISGFSDGTFRPHASLRREDAVIILSRSFGFLSGYSASDVFKDEDDITPAAFGAISYAYRKNIISGFPDGTFRPSAALTRAQAAVMILKVLDLEQTEPGFFVGYPRVAEHGIYGCIRLEISTNMPCSIYYLLQPSSMVGTPARININNFLAVTTAGNRQISADIVCDVGNEYDVFLLAATADGRYSRIIKIENQAASPFTEGDGSKWSPYGIYNELQLNAIRYFPKSAYILKSDIELTGIWTPISGFTGVLDGGGFRISGLNVEEEKNNGGFFSQIKGGEIRDLAIDGKVSAKSNAGIFAGEMSDTSVVGCVATGYVSAATNNAGGFFGESAGLVENCLSAVYLVEASAFSGGIAGQNYGIIRESISAAHTVTADMYAGGIAAVNVGGIIERNLSACINVFDIMMNNCGRIALNKEGGITHGNYGYDKMNTTSENGVNDSDNLNGADICWEDMINHDAVIELLGWDERLWSGGGRENKYLIIYPSRSKMPELIYGICEYAPLRIENAAQMLGIIDNPDRHYIIVNDIRFDSSINWKSESSDPEQQKGFSGSLDGGGHVVSGIVLDGGDEKGGLFATVGNATIRNLTLTDMKISGYKLAGAFAGENYGTIENCSAVNVTITSDEDTSYIGGIAGYNYGTIRNADSYASLVSTSKNTVIGGICAHNEGFLDNTSYRADIKSSKTVSLSESVIGGICGYNAGGMIYNSYVSGNIRQQATTMYVGGICGIQADGEVYKCSTDGIILSEPPRHVMASAYSGGIMGLCAGGLIMNSFSTSDLTVYAVKGYVGGICGYSESGMIQNVYAANDVIQISDDTFENEILAYAGGICGYNEIGMIAQSAAVNRIVSSSQNTGRIFAGGEAEQVFFNIAVSDMSIKNGLTGAFAGDSISLQKFSYDLFVSPLSEGGILGWSDEVWTKSVSQKYFLPVLRDVKGQEFYIER